MNLKRGIIISIIFWILIFFEVSILMFGFDIQPGLIYYIIHYIMITLFLIISAIFYFKKVKSNLKEGFLLGIILIVTGTILDAIITIPLSIKSYSFFLDLYLLIGYLWAIILSSIIGYLYK